MATFTAQRVVQNITMMANWHLRYKIDLSIRSDCGCALPMAMESRVNMVGVTMVYMIAIESRLARAKRTRPSSTETFRATRQRQMTRRRTRTTAVETVTHIMACVKSE